MKAHEIISEAEDNDTFYKKWRKEVGTDKQTTRDIVSGPSPKPNRSMSDDLAAMNKKLAKKEDAVSESDDIDAKIDYYEKALAKAIKFTNSKPANSGENYIIPWYRKKIKILQQKKDAKQQTASGNRR